MGNFPALWSEWNGKYRDSIRKFWKGDGGMVSEFATRFTGSSDLYEWSSRRPHASINFVTCHDGFTLNDLVSYDEKHNEANGEENRDGESNNNSWNCGHEGPTDDPAINQACGRRKCGASWRPCCSPRACRCSRPEMKSAARSLATTTRTARTTS